MRHAQGLMAHLARLINWRNFAARNGSDEVRVSPEDLLVYACRDDRQAVAWVLRDREALECEGDLPFRPLLTDAAVELPPPASGTYLATCVDTHNGHTLAETLISSGAGPMRLDLPPFCHDIAIAIRPAD